MRSCSSAQIGDRDDWLGREVATIEVGHRLAPFCCVGLFALAVPVARGFSILVERKAAWNQAGCRGFEGIWDPAESANEYGQRFAAQRSILHRNPRV